MKKNVFILCSLFFTGILFHCAHADAELLDLYMEFSYVSNGTEDPIAFNLYCDGTLVHVINHEPGSESFFIESQGATILSFTLTAVWNSDYESPHSKPYLFTVKTTELKPPQGFQFGSFTENEEDYSSFFSKKINSFSFAKKAMLCKI